MYPTTPRQPASRASMRSLLCTSVAAALAIVAAPAPMMASGWRSGGRASGRGEPGRGEPGRGEAGRREAGEVTCGGFR